MFDDSKTFFFVSTPCFQTFYCDSWYQTPDMTHSLRFQFPLLSANQKVWIQGTCATHHGCSCLLSLFMSKITSILCFWIQLLSLQTTLAPALQDFLNQTWSFMSSTFSFKSGCTFNTSFKASWRAIRKSKQLHFQSRRITVMVCIGSSHTPQKITYGGAESTRNVLYAAGSQTEVHCPSAYNFKLSFRTLCASRRLE